MARPQKTRIRPSLSVAAIGATRACNMLPVFEKTPVAGSYGSADPGVPSPATRTEPLGNSAAIDCRRVELVSPVLERSQLVRLMKTVLAVRQQAKQESIRRMAQTMCDQLIEIMPELANIGPWHAVGKRRRLTELGVAAQRRLGEEVFIDRDE